MIKRKSKTCISACRLKSGELIMAGDRRVSFNDGSIYTSPIPKIKKSWNGILTGASGDSGLCKTIVDIFEPPKIETEDIDLYMHYNYIPAIEKHIKSIPGYKDEHNLLRIGQDEECLVLLAIENRVFTIDILSYNIGSEGMYAIPRIILDDAPCPWAIGCGAGSAMPVLMDEYKTKGYNTKNGLTKAMSIAADLNSGCDNQIDYIST